MEDDKTRRAQWNLVAVILAVTFAIMWYLVTVAKHLEQTSALFIGIPAAIAIMVSLAPEESVTVERIVPANSTEVQATLAHGPRVNGKLALYLRLKFPRPVSARGEGLEQRDQRVIHFAGGEGHPGDLVMQVTESEP